MFQPTPEPSSSLLPTPHQPSDDDTFHTDGSLDQLGLQNWVIIVFEVFLLVTGIACCYMHVAARTADLGSEKLVEVTNLDEIKNELKTWRDSHSMLFVLDWNLQMLAWSEGMIRVGSVWSCSQKILAVLSLSPESLTISNYDSHVTPYMYAPTIRTMCCIDRWS